MSVPNPPPSPPMPQHRRRSSFAEMFNPRGNASNSTAISSSPPSAAVPSTPGGTVQHRRGTSITALGLTTNPSNQTPFGAFGLQRRASVATSSSVASSPEFRNSFSDEPAVLEEDDPTRATMNPPASPSFARRVSFGAQALRDVRMGGSPGASGGEGFNWSDALRDRTKRSPSFSSGNPFNQGTARPRSISTSSPEPPKEIPKPIESTPVRMKKPDHLGERMLRGDFMMD